MSDPSSSSSSSPPASSWGQPSWGVAATSATAPAAAPDAAIVAWGLSRTFGQKTAVDQLNLNVRRGEFYGFLGRNGAGKSTTIKMMVGLLRPSAGQVLIGGVDMWREPLRAKALIGVLPEHLNLYERLRGRELVELAGRLYDLPKHEVRRRAEALLRVLGLADDAEKLVIDYSVGMRKKVALASALIHRPQVLFLDEPFEGIDPVSSRVIRDILRDLTASGTTIFFSSHIMEVVERLCTRVGIIDNGRLLASGTLPELRDWARAAGVTGTGPGDEVTLEDVFFRLVGVRPREGGLEWLE